MVKKLIFFIILIIFFSAFSIGVYAEEVVPDEYEEFLEGLPDDIRELLPEGLFSNEQSFSNLIQP